MHRFQNKGYINSTQTQCYYIVYPPSAITRACNFACILYIALVWEVLELLCYTMAENIANFISISTTIWHAHIAAKSKSTLSALSAGIRIPRLYHLQRSKPPTHTHKRGVLGIALNWIWWQESSSGDLESVENSFIAIISIFTLTWNSSTCWGPMSQMELFKHYLYLVGLCAKTISKKTATQKI